MTTTLAGCLNCTRAFSIGAVRLCSIWIWTPFYNCGGPAFTISPTPTLSIERLRPLGCSTQARALVGTIQQELRSFSGSELEAIEYVRQVRGPSSWPKAQRALVPGDGCRAGPDPVFRRRRGIRQRIIDGMRAAGYELRVRRAFSSTSHAHTSRAAALQKSFATRARNARAGAPQVTFVRILSESSRRMPRRYVENSRFIFLPRATESGLGRGIPETVASVCRAERLPIHGPSQRR